MGFGAEECKADVWTSTTCYALPQVDPEFGVCNMARALKIRRQFIASWGQPTMHNTQISTTLRKAGGAMEIILSVCRVPFKEEEIN